MVATAVVIAVNWLRMLQACTPSIVHEIAAHHLCRLAMELTDASTVFVSATNYSTAVKIETAQCQNATRSN